MFELFLHFGLHFLEIVEAFSNFIAHHLDLDQHFMWLLRQSFMNLVASLFQNLISFKLVYQDSRPS